MQKSTQGRVKPFLRWAGGKTWFINQVCEFVSSLDYKHYHEPFLGGGSTYFAIDSCHGGFLSDANQELIETYLTLKKDPYAVIRRMKKYTNSPEFYYKLRDEFRGRCAAEKAARFIFLNQTSYNGLYRVNLNGHYNVPYGFRTKEFLDEKVLIAASKKLENATISAGDFDTALDRVEQGDLVFLDPPYTVSHNNNGFIKYNQRLFSLDDQERLSAFIDEVRRRQAYYILTNAAHPTIAEIFEKGDTRIR